jgi:hypothetical protein
MRLRCIKHIAHHTHLCIGIERKDEYLVWRCLKRGIPHTAEADGKIVQPPTTHRVTRQVPAPQQRYSSDGSNQWFTDQQHLQCIQVLGSITITLLMVVKLGSSIEG